MATVLTGISPHLFEADMSPHLLLAWIFKVHSQINKAVEQTEPVCHQEAPMQADDPPKRRQFTPRLSWIPLEALFTDVMLPVWKFPKVYRNSVPISHPEWKAYRNSWSQFTRDFRPLGDVI